MCAFWCVLSVPGRMYYRHPSCIVTLLDKFKRMSKNHDVSSISYSADKSNGNDSTSFGGLILIELL